MNVKLWTLVSTFLVLASCALAQQDQVFFADLTTEQVTFPSAVIDNDNVVINKALAMEYLSYNLLNASLQNITENDFVALGLTAFHYQELVSILQQELAHITLLNTILASRNYSLTAVGCPENITVAANVTEFLRWALVMHTLAEGVMSADLHVIGEPVLLTLWGSMIGNHARHAAFFSKLVTNVGSPYNFDPVFTLGGSLFLEDLKSQCPEFETLEEPLPFLVVLSNELQFSSETDAGSGNQRSYCECPISMDLSGLGVPYNNETIFSSYFTGFPWAITPNETEVSETQTATDTAFTDTEFTEPVFTDTAFTETDTGFTETATGTETGPGTGNVVDALGCICYQPGTGTEGTSFPTETVEETATDTAFTETDTEFFTATETEAEPTDTGFF